MKKCLFIINPNAGKKNDLDQTIQIVQGKLNQYDIELWKTTGEDDLTAVQNLLAKKELDLVLVGGGDGTVRMVANALIRKEIPMGILPLGSANGLASCLNIHDTEQALDTIINGRTMKMDVLKINEEISLHLSDFGFNANLVKKFEEEGDRGMFAYFKSSLSQIFATQAGKFDIHINGDVIETETKMLVIANGDRYGTGAVISPDSKLDDGYFELIALNPEDIDDLLKISLALFRGGLEKLETVKSWSASSAKILNKGNFQFQIDGEVMGIVECIDIEMINNAVMVYY